jgi:hypothetical protein
MTDDDPRGKVTGPDHNHLTKLGEHMLRLADQFPGVRAIVFLDEGQDGAVVMTGYGKADVPARILADAVDHVCALAQAYEVAITIAIGPRAGLN